jgi:non-canonical purine NTP pyrophosphatase (RdgB/HAM1 family)
MNKLCFVTGNKGKMKEAQEILGFPIDIEQLDLDEIQSLDLAEIVTHKAQQAFEKIKRPLIVDDVGLYINAWNGFPGPFIKFLLQSGGNELLVKLLSTDNNRTVIARAAIGYHDGSGVKTFIGDVKGSLAEAPRGNGGWGWDPVFIPEHSTMTYAEMGPEQKNKISHRRAALEKLKMYLKENSITYSTSR